MHSLRTASNRKNLLIKLIQKLNGIFELIFHELSISLLIVYFSVELAQDPLTNPDPLLHRLFEEVRPDLDHILQVLVVLLTDAFTMLSEVHCY